VETMLNHVFIATVRGPINTITIMYLLIQICRMDSNKIQITLHRFLL